MNQRAFIPPESHASPAAISVVDAVKSFGNRRVLDRIGLVVPQGQILAIVGESGCGKSTLLRLLAGLETPSSGAISVTGQVSIAFQDARLLPWLKVWENIGFGLEARVPERLEKALTVLDEVGLRKLADAWPATLSGGEGQRVALARALVRDPAVLLLDEPFGALDALTRIRMHALFLSLWEKHRFTSVLVTHDVDEALTLADRVIVLGAGVILDEFQVQLPRPRGRLDARFGALHNRLLGQLGVPAL